MPKVQLDLGWWSLSLILGMVSDPLNGVNEKKPSNRMVFGNLPLVN